LSAEVGGLGRVCGPSTVPKLPVATKVHFYMYIYRYIYIQSTKKKGREWVHVKIIELMDKSHKHKYCKLVLVADASCIRKHFLHSNPAYGVVKCTADEVVLQPILDEMRALAA